MVHTVVARRDLLAANPGLARAIYTAFLAAKEAGAERYRQFRRLYEVPVMVPWLNALMEENGRLLGPDRRPYGISANRTALGTYLRYHSEQGLSACRWTSKRSPTRICGTPEPGPVTRRATSTARWAAPATAPPSWSGWPG